MAEGSYTLGIDIGDGTVVAAVRPADESRPAHAVPATGLSTGPAGADGPADRPGLPVPIGQALRRVGSPTPMYVAGRPVDPASVVASLAVQVIGLATLDEGTTAAWTVLTVPPSWGGHRRDLLADALRAAGVEHFSLESSSVAVARHHAGVVPAAAPVLVVDLGASTVDTAVVRTTADDRVETLAPPPAPLAWGGRDVDDAVVQLVQECLAVEDAAGPDGPATTPAALKDACVAAKEALSTDTVAGVELAGADGPISLRLVREDLDELIAGPLEAVVATARRAVAEAELEVADLAAVVLAGGTAAVPLVAETLSAALDRPVVVAAEPALTAALGAAQLAGDRLVAETAAEPTEHGAADADPVEATDEAAAVPAHPVRRGAARPAAASRKTPRPGTPPGAGRPPARSGTRPPVPTPDPQGRRHAARVGVVLSGFVAIVLGVAAAVSSTWSGGAGADAPAVPAVAEQVGVAEDAGQEAASSGLSPAAAGAQATQRAAADRDGATARTSGRSTPSATPGTRSSSANAGTSASQGPASAGSASTSSTAGPETTPPAGNQGTGEPGPGTPDQELAPVTGVPAEESADPPATSSPSAPLPPSEVPTDPAPDAPPSVPPVEPPVAETPESPEPETPVSATDPTSTGPTTGAGVPAPGQA